MTEQENGNPAGHPRVFTVGGLPGSILKPEPLCSSSLQEVPPCPWLLLLVFPGGLYSQSLNMYLFSKSPFYLC